MASEIVYLDGEYVPKAEAKVSVFDHGLLYGDGVFEGIRFYKRNIFRLDQHLDRLFSSAKYILLKIGMTKEELTAALQETCRRNGLDDGYIRLLVTRGVGTLGLSPYQCEKPSVIIIASTIRLYPAELYEKGLSVVTTATRRTAPDCMSPRVKSLNYLNNIMAKLECIHAGADEGIMLDAGGHIVECTADNFFIVKKGQIYTPPTSQGALRGITRDAVIEIARELGYKVNEEKLSLYEAYDADECFLTGTAAEIVPVASIDKRPIGEGHARQITQKLLEKFQGITAIEGVRF
ncbi:branched-chain-amino-acid transaminase [soil metagenome]